MSVNFQPFYTHPTEDPEGIREILIANNIRDPRNVLTVVGGLLPDLFLGMFPGTKIATFDNNPNQIDYYMANRQHTTKRNPVLMDVTDTQEFIELLKNVSPDLVYLSNLVNYLLTPKASELADALIGQRIGRILVSSLEKEDHGFNTFNVNATNTFLRRLNMNGYNTDHLRLPNSPYQIKNFYLETLGV